MFNGGMLEVMGVKQGPRTAHTPDKFTVLKSIISKCDCGEPKSFVGNCFGCVCFACAQAGGAQAGGGGGAAAAPFECRICCADRPSDEEFRIDGCGHSLCSTCVERLAANGRDMFNCPFCKNPIKNYGGSVAEDKPHWTMDPDSLLGDDIDDEQECDACGQVGLLVMCDGCDIGMHHACAGIDPAHEPASWMCESCSGC